MDDDCFMHASTSHISGRLIRLWTVGSRIVSPHEIIPEQLVEKNQQVTEQ